MEVNREWWSGTERYINNSDNIDPDHVLTTIGDLSTDIPLSPTKYIGVEWDKTICPWKINYKSDFFNPQWCLPYYQSGSGDFKMVQAPFFKQRKKGYTFYMSAAGGTASYQPHEILSYYAATKPCWINLLSRSDIDITQNPAQQWVYEKYYKTFPVVNFDYSKLFAFPMIHIENGSGHIFSDTAQAREDWDATGVYGVSIMFGVKTPYNGTDIVSVGIHSLNNEIEPPPWDTTNCWKENAMFDNGLALTHWNSWDGGWEIGGIQTLGTECTWSDSGASAGDPGFTDTQYPSDNVAGAILYYPAKNIMIQMPADSDDETLWDEWSPYYKGGSHEYSVRRHLKSSVTFDQFATYLKKQLAYLGFRFCVDAEHFNDSIDTQYYYIPEIDSKGVTTGNYIAANAPEAQNYINYGWNTNVYDVTPYDGTDDDEGGDPNNYDEENKTELNGLAARAKNYFFNVYALSTVQLRQLSEYMYTDMPTNANQDNFLTNNAIDVVVSLMMFPIDFTGFSTPENLTLGKLTPTYWDEEAQENKPILARITSTNILVFPCGSCTYYPVYGVDDFRNYEPYCTAELELPYCGNIKLPTSVYLNHTISVTYLIDLITGSCMALIYRDNLVYTTAQGQMGVQFPLSGIQSQDLQANIMRKQTQYGESLINVARSVIGGSVGTAGATQAASTTAGLSGTLGALTGVASAFNQLEQAEYNVEHIQVPFTMHGASSPLTSFANEQYPRLIVKRPRMLPNYEAASYGHLVGFACNITAPLSEFTGLTVCATANLDNIAATEAEKQLIRRALLEGVIL